jgi:hypothetical protein
MIRLTVLYNLPPGSDEEEFLRWRLSDHQDSNAAMEGVIRTDFARVDQPWPNDGPPRFRFMTVVEWEDWDSFQRGFYDEEVQAKLRIDVQRISDQVFLISEVLTETRNR